MNFQTMYFLLTNNYDYMTNNDHYETRRDYDLAINLRRLTLAETSRPASEGKAAPQSLLMVLLWNLISMSTWLKM